ncbi:unnamed protein product [Mycena citricolor]|uniref:Phosphatidylinositol N-acetylglucosaminyltransferase n=1 Tax=Mycena citricolor TaxID=2018698 RepID=A0AAD2HSW8_9AGAR|nr:unnamed protein product [Mycena citricolor]
MSGQSETFSETQHRWERVLWRRQAHPDNHIVPGFLSSLQQNVNFRPYTYWELVLLSGTITQHIASVFVFVAIFLRLREEDLDPYVLVWISVGCFLIGYFLWELLDRIGASRLQRHVNRVKTIKSSILIFLALMSLSPVLRTLTAATSSDSIWALSAILFGANALLADYSAMPENGVQAQERLTSVLSINAAIAASVVLASRLAADTAVFALILFSVQTFALFPRLRHRLGSRSALVRVAFTVLLLATSVVAAKPVMRMAIWVYASVQLAVTFLAPAVLVWAQKFKNEIRGPWDVAVPKVNK